MADRRDRRPKEAGSSGPRDAEPDPELEVASSRAEDVARPYEREGATNPSVDEDTQVGIPDVVPEGSSTATAEISLFDVELDSLDDELREVIESIATVAGTRRLRLLDEIARGGMGIVRAVLDDALMRRAAMKVLTPSLGMTPRRVAMFIREAQITAQLDHPNIVPVHDIGVDDEGRLHFTMKLVTGETLRRKVRTMPRRPYRPGELSELLEVVTKVCDAVGFAHSRGVIHCDVTPLNIMVGDFGQVYLMDWGIARPGSRAIEAAEPSDEARARADELVSTSGTFADAGVTGTPVYMSPEHAGAGALSERSDVFQIGALLFFILTREPPYHGEGRDVAMMRARVCDVKPPSEVAGWARIPPALERIVLRAMAEDPEDRFESPAALREELTRFMWGGEAFDRIEVPAGEHLIREGDVGDCAYILVSGLVEAYKTIRGERVSLRRMGPGEVFGEMAVLTASERTASVVALEDCEVLVVTAVTLEAELEGMKPWMGALTRALATRLKEREEALLTRD